MNRRQFIRRLEVLTGGAAALSAGGCLPFQFANVTVAGRRLLVQTGDIGDRGVLVDPPGGQLPIFVHRLADGGYSAVSTRCMHRGCPVEPTADRLVCPCHGSEYSYAGDVLKGPTERPLRRFEVVAGADVVAIELPAEGEVW